VAPLLTVSELVPAFPAMKKPDPASQLDPTPSTITVDRAVAVVAKVAPTLCTSAPLRMLTSARPLLPRFMLPVMFQALPAPVTVTVPTAEAPCPTVAVVLLT
jgi:hypothetical protein